MSLLISSILLLIMSFERGINENLSSAASSSTIFANFNAAGFMGVSPIVCSLHSVAIRYATSYDAVRIGLSKGIKPREGGVLYSKLALLTLNSASVVSLYFPSQCCFRKCSFSFAGATLEFLSLALQIMHWWRWIPSLSFLYVNPYCTYSSDHFVFLHIFTRF